MPYGSGWPLAARRSPNAVPGRRVDVLDEVPGGLDAACAEVHDEHRLDTSPPCPRDEVVGTDQVRLDRAPRQVLPDWPLRAWADAILPAVAGHEVAPRVPDQGYTEAAYEAEHVAPPAVDIGRGWPGS